MTRNLNSQRFVFSRAASSTAVHTRSRERRYSFSRVQAQRQHGGQPTGDEEEVSSEAKQHVSSCHFLAVWFLRTSRENEPDGLISHTAQNSNRTSNSGLGCEHARLYAGPPTGRLSTSAKITHAGLLPRRVVGRPRRYRWL